MRAVPARQRRRLAAGAASVGVGVLALTAGVLGATSALAEPSHRPGGDQVVVAPGTRLWVDPDSTTRRAADRLTGQAREDALRLAAVPGATWFTGGTPSEVRTGVANVVSRARAAGAVPVIVAYNLPQRDCGSYSAGGARTTEDYVAWVTAMARGIGRDPAIVVLEPDGLGLIPWFTSVSGDAGSCRPSGVDPATAASDRFRALNRAVDLLDLQRTSVYLDGTHSGWLGVGDAADRLVRAGVTRADGVFLNVSNFETTGRQVRYGRWVSQCVDLVTRAGASAVSCPSQYWPADPGDVSTWSRTDDAFAAAYASTGLTPDPSRMPHVVVDTSRNGLGPWTPSQAFTDPETWCNPPGRGLGQRPTTTTGDPWVDAFLWVKVPGESDGRCHRGTAGPQDPARGVVDPEAGGWFPDLARELVANASPAL